MKAREDLLSIIDDIYEHQHKRKLLKYTFVTMLLLAIHIPLIVGLFK